MDRRVGPAGLTVEVLDPAGKPVAGAVIELLRFEGQDTAYHNLDIGEFQEHRVAAKLPTTKNGRIGIHVPVAIPFRLRADVPPYAIEHRSGIYAGQELTIQLRPGATISGVEVGYGAGTKTVQLASGQLDGFCPRTVPAITRIGPRLSASHR